MSTAIQRRRGTTAQHASFAGLNGELTVDTDKEVVVVHDGATAGGYPMMRENGSNSALALGSAGTPSLKFTGDTNTGIYSPGADQVAISTGGSGRLFVDANGQTTLNSGATAYPLNIDSTNPYGTTVVWKDSGVTFAKIGGAGESVSGANKNDFGINYNVTNASRNLIIASNGTERLRITSAGLVGVGTSSPATALDVAGQINATTGFASNRFGVNATPLSTTTTSESFARFKTTGGDFYIGTESSTAGGFFTGSTAYAACLYNSAATPIQFFTGGTVKATLDSSGRLGIGTSSPGQRLEVAGETNPTIRITPNGQGDSWSTSAEYGKVQFWNTDFEYGGGGEMASISAGVNTVFGGHGYLKLLAGSSGSMRFWTNGSEAMRIDASQRVGIGTTSPSNALHIAATTPTIRLQDTDGGRAMVSGADGNLTFEADPDSAVASSHIKFNVDDTERARIDSSGRWLLGTSSTSGVHKLVVQARTDSTTGNGGIVLARGSTPSGADQGIGIVAFENNNSNTGAYVYAESDGAWTAGTSHPTRLGFWTCASGANNPTERMRITNDGKALFGGTTSTTAKWNFWDTDSTGMAWLSATTSGNYRRAYLWGSAGSQALYFTNGNNEANLSSAGAWTNASDARIKKDIEPISYGLAEVMASQPRKYKMIADDQECIGFVAQEMLKIVPEVVSGGETEDRKYCLDYGSLVAVAFKAIQEQQAIIEGLEARLATLESA